MKRSVAKLAREIAVSDLPSVSFGRTTKLPRASGVYFALIDDRVMYIGVSVDIRDRWRHGDCVWKLRGVPRVRIAWWTCDCVYGCEFDRALEPLLIQRFQPPINRLHVKPCNRIDFQYQTSYRNSIKNYLAVNGKRAAG